MLTTGLFLRSLAFHEPSWSLELSLTSLFWVPAYVVTSGPPSGDTDADRFPRGDAPLHLNFYVVDPPSGRGPEGKSQPVAHVAALSGIDVVWVTLR